MASMPHVRVPVVVRAGDRKPGHGFYILTRELAYRVGHDQAAEEKLGIGQIAGTIEYSARMAAA
jgi:hypothetical protein